MWKLKYKNGNSLIEVMASLAIFSILFFTAMSIELSSIKLKQYNKITNKYTEILECVKCKLIFNTTYSEIKNLCHQSFDSENNVLIGSENKAFINSENLEFEKIKCRRIQDIFSENQGSGKDFIKLIITEVDSVIRIVIELHYGYNNKESIIRSEFCKGNYL